MEETQNTERRGFIYDGGNIIISGSKSLLAVSDPAIRNFAQNYRRKFAERKMYI